MIYKSITRNEIHINCTVKEYNTMDYQRTLRQALAQDIDKVVVEISMIPEEDN